MKKLIINSNRIFNALGMRCPETLMMLRKNIRSMQVGQKLLIITDDATAIRDFPIFCEFMNHSLINHKIKEIPYYFLIRKGSSHSP
ncbi:MAG: sulfurtransferase TusA [Candidatus Dasytiphilus stammeri]